MELCREHVGRARKSFKSEHRREKSCKLFFFCFFGGEVIEYLEKETSIFSTHHVQTLEILEQPKANQVLPRHDSTKPRCKQLNRWDLKSFHPTIWTKFYCVIFFLMFLKLKAISILMRKWKLKSSGSLLLKINSFFWTPLQSMFSVGRNALTWM